MDAATIDGFGVLHVAGWALTSDCPGCALGIYVKVNGARQHVEYHLANKLRTDVGTAYPGYGNNHGFDFSISIGRDPSAVLITVEALNGSTPFTLSGSKYITSAYNGITPPPGSDAFYSPFYGGTATRTQFQGLVTNYRVLDNFPGATPSQTAIASAIATGANWFGPSTVSMLPSASATRSFSTSSIFSSIPARMRPLRFRRCVDVEWNR